MTSEHALSLSEQVKVLLDEACETLGAEHRADCAALRDRLEEPLRVAIAGKVKAGKSTLLNALVGERMAPTDTSECTRVVTWYRNGQTYAATGYLRDGTTFSVAMSRGEGAVELDLQGRSPDDVAYLELVWPSSRLAAHVLIDTPGIDSVNTEVSNRAWTFLDTSTTDKPADAVLFLMKHMHASDVRLLETFHDNEQAQSTPINAIAVLSRADEIAAGRLDAMASARKIAARYTNEATLRTLVQTVVPVAGLLAETALTLTQAEFDQLRQLAEVAPSDMERHVLSADRFVEAEPGVPCTSLERSALLRRFGLFGIRVSLALIRRNVATTATELAEELERRSGICELRELLGTLFVDRTDVLKARSVLLALERLCNDRTDPAAARIQRAIERLKASAHPFAELTTLAQLRTMSAAGDELVVLERVLGGVGTSLRCRLGLGAEAPDEALPAAAYEQLAVLHQRAESPFVSHELADAYRVGVRSLEQAVASLTTSLR